MERRIYRRLQRLATVYDAPERTTDDVIAGLEAGTLLIVDLTDAELLAVIEHVRGEPLPDDGKTLERVLLEMKHASKQPQPAQ